MAAIELQLVVAANHDDFEPHLFSGYTVVQYFVGLYMNISDDVARLHRY